MKQNRFVTDEDRRSLKETQVDSKEIYNGKIIRVYLDNITLCDSSPKKREVVKHPGGVGILAKTSDNYIYFVKQYRYPIGDVIVELPAGKLDKGESEDILECAKRELSEEVGVTGENYVYLGKMLCSPGISNEVTHMYYCDVASVGENHLDEGEFLNGMLIKADEALEMVMNGEIEDGKTVLAITKAKILGLI